MDNKNNHHQNVKDLCNALLLLESEEEVFNFLKDLCTPTELASLAERWQICKALNSGLSYREIHAQLGASLTTIGRVARFLKDEPYQGYKVLLTKISQ
ncbi:MAG: transcriptional regulator [Rickettsiaceae bacterium]|nr:transcriptional regulator [Rickettsiaceae bacterium]